MQLNSMNKQSLAVVYSLMAFAIIFNLRTATADTQAPPACTGTEQHVSQEPDIIERYVVDLDHDGTAELITLQRPNNWSFYTVQVNTHCGMVIASNEEGDIQRFLQAAAHESCFPVNCLSRLACKVDNLGTALVQTRIEHTLSDEDALAARNGQLPPEHYTGQVRETTWQLEGTVFVQRHETLTPFSGQHHPAAKRVRDQPLLDTTGCPVNELLRYPGFDPEDERMDRLYKRQQQALAVLETRCMSEAGFDRNDSEAAQQSDWRNAMYGLYANAGEDGTGPDGKPIMAGQDGCAGVAERSLTRVYKRIGKLKNQRPSFHPDTIDDARQEAVEADWSSCMASHGHEVKTRFDMYANRTNHDEQAGIFPDAQLCYDSVMYRERLRAIEAEHQNDFTRRHRDLLEQSLVDLSDAEAEIVRILGIEK